MEIKPVVSMITMVTHSNGIVRKGLTWTIISVIYIIIVVFFNWALIIRKPNNFKFHTAPQNYRAELTNMSTTRRAVLRHLRRNLP